ncbi:hypothetical protein VNO77_27196 [Canavalia gladiata]|uniref:Uncharacterized protein n=1 Tax=Canavalia gladiata TaxID=3824 RepID=A0AAN9Q692_CANGL
MVGGHLHVGGCALWHFGTNSLSYKSAEHVSEMQGIAIKSALHSQLRIDQSRGHFDGHFLHGSSSSRILSRDLIDYLYAHLCCPMVMMGQILVQFLVPVVEFSRATYPILLLRLTDLLLLGLKRSSLVPALVTIIQALPLSFTYPMVLVIPGFKANKASRGSNLGIQLRIRLAAATPVRFRESFFSALLRHYLGYSLGLRSRMVTQSLQSMALFDWIKECSFGYGRAPTFEHSPAITLVLSTLKMFNVAPCYCFDLEDLRPASFMLQEHTCFTTWSTDLVEDYEILRSKLGSIRFEASLGRVHEEGDA